LVNPPSYLARLARMNSEPLTVEEARAVLGPRLYDAVLWSDEKMVLLCPSIVFWEIVNDEVLSSALWPSYSSWSELVRGVRWLAAPGEGGTSLARKLQLWHIDFSFSSQPTPKPAPSVVYIMPDPGQKAWFVSVDLVSADVDDVEHSLRTLLLNHHGGTANINIKVSTSPTSPSSSTSPTSPSSSSSSSTVQGPGFIFHHESKILRTTVPIRALPVPIRALPVPIRAEPPEQPEFLVDALLELIDA